jgi:ATP-dependent Lon protease
MEVLELTGYTEEEKLEIAFSHLLPRQLEAHGLTKEQMEVTPEAVRRVISSYTREAGLRNLEREIAALCRGVAREVAEGGRQQVKLAEADVAQYLGPPRFFREAALDNPEPGVATGLAWTPAGGDILFIEALRMPGKGNLKLTGQLGDVMKESASAALSYIRARAPFLGIEEDFFEKSDLHIHVPAGAIPKDGPSAGVAMLCALVSLLSGRPVKKGLAMTGEITLRGRPARGRHRTRSWPPTGPASRRSSSRPRTRWTWRRSPSPSGASSPSTRWRAWTRPWSWPSRRQGSTEGQGRGHRASGTGF